MTLFKRGSNHHLYFYVLYLYRYKTITSKILFNSFVQVPVRHYKCIKENLEPLLYWQIVTWIYKYIEYQFIPLIRGRLNFWLIEFIPASGQKIIFMVVSYLHYTNCIIAQGNGIRHPKAVLKALVPLKTLSMLLFYCCVKNHHV